MVYEGRWDSEQQYNEFDFSDETRLFLYNFSVLS